MENFKTTLSLSCPELNVNDFFLTYWKLQHTVQEERVQPVLNGRRAEGTCTPSTSMQPPVSGDSEMLVHVPPTPQIRASHVSNSSIFLSLSSSFGIKTINLFTIRSTVTKPQPWYSLTASPGV